eukprot:7697005-Lingulodinium_polyedra.AAC.1
MLCDHARTGATPVRTEPQTGPPDGPAGPCAGEWPPAPACPGAHNLALSGTTTSLAIPTNEPL